MDRKRARAATPRAELKNQPRARSQSAHRWTSRSRRKPHGAERPLRISRFRSPPTASFLDDVIAGLSAPRKSLPPKYFYDERGSRLFDAICELPEYYPTRTELAHARGTPRPKSRAHRPGVPRSSNTAADRAARPRMLLRAVQPLVYVAIDISGEQLRDGGRRARLGEFPERAHGRDVRRLHARAAARDAGRARRPPARGLSSRVDDRQFHRARGARVPAQRARGGRPGRRRCSSAST